MIHLRSLIFHICFWGFLILTLIFGVPFLYGSKIASIKLMKFWARVSVLLLRVICGTRLEVRGLEHIPQGEGGYLVAAKHQSMFETIALLLYFPQPIFILKRQLIEIPVFGKYLKKFGMIAVDRDGGGAALRNITEQAKAALAQGHQIIIFPEGTRTPPYAPADYKSGIVHLYRQLECPILPVALNSGLLWARRAFCIHPGTIVFEFLPPIATGLPKQEILPMVQNLIETHSTALLPHQG